MLLYARHVRPYSEVIFPLALPRRPLQKMLEPQETEARQQEQSQDYLVHWAGSWRESTHDFMMIVFVLDKMRSSLKYGEKKTDRQTSRLLGKPVVGSVRACVRACVCVCVCACVCVILTYP